MPCTEGGLLPAFQRLLTPGLLPDRLQDLPSGYWVLVLHFTRREAVEQIELLEQVATNLGRSKCRPGGAEEPGGGRGTCSQFPARRGAYSRFSSSWAWFLKGACQAVRPVTSSPRPREKVRSRPSGPPWGHKVLRSP